MNFSVYTLLSFFVIGSLQADICKDSVMGMLKVGEFFHKKNSKLHTNQSIETTMKHFKVDNSQFKQKPSYKIASWFQLLEQTHLRRSQDSRVKERLRNYYHKKHI
ncbi:MAG: hypothetical protein H6622_17565, partial [Halobacteriovoraceae bacterium]|nr:hypothetical protein [Halobacteriovoraceae bacterium]